MNFMYYKLASRTTTPPAGFIIRIRRLKYEKQYWDFNSAVNGYVQIASANPGLGLSTEWSAVAEIVDIQNAARVARIAGASGYVVQVEGSVPEEAICSTRPGLKKCCGLK